jgi:hypothetical protein
MASDTFEDVIQRMKDEGDLNRNSGSHSIKSVKTEYLAPMLESFQMIAENTSRMVEVMMDSMLFDQQNAKRDELEALKEKDKKAGGTVGAAGTVEDESKGLFDSLKDMNGGFGSILGTAILAAVTAYALDIDKYFRTVMLGKSIKSLGNIITGISKFATKVAAYFRLFGKDGSGFLKNIGKIFQKIGNSIKFVGKIFKSVGTFIDTIFVGPFRMIGKLIAPILKFAPKLLSVFKTIPVVGQLIGLLFGVFDFVSGFIKGFSSKGENDTRSIGQKALDGLFAGLIKLVKGIFIVPLDLLKDGVSWLAKKMGFENFSAALDGFSFNDTFDKILKVFSNLFSLEPEEGYFSITKFISDQIDSLFTFFDTAALDGFSFNDTFDKILKVFSNLFSSKPEKGYFSITKFISDQIDSLFTFFDTLKMPNPIQVLKTLLGNNIDLLTNPVDYIYNRVLKPAIDGIASLFGSGFEMPEMDLSLPSMDLSLPSFDIPAPGDILATVGSKINDVFQSLAESIASMRFLPGKETLAGFISDAGTSAGNLFGAENLSKFNVGSEKMEVPKPSGMKASSEVGPASQDIAAEKENRTSTTVVGGPTNTDASTVHNTSVSYAEPAAKARKQRRALGLRAKPRLD